MNIQQFEYIVAVSRLFHFGLAAEACCVTQSTLSSMIGKFEQEIGITIFNRHRKPVTITHEGRKVIDRLQAILKEVGELKETVKSLKGELSGEVRIGVIPTVAPYLLPRFFRRFTKQHPQIHCSVSELTTEAIVRGLHDGKLDLGILAIPLEDGMLQEHPLYNEEFVLFDSNRTSSCSEADVDAIDYEKFWLLEESHCLGRQMIRICDLKNRDRGSPMHFEFKAGSIDSLMRFVRANSGVTFLPYLATLDLPEADRQKLLFFQRKVPLRTIGLVTHRYFVKNKVLESLKMEIQDSVIPLLNPHASRGSVVFPM